MQSGFDKELIMPGSENDGRVKVDAADSLGYLANKLVPGSNVILTVNPNYIVVNAEVETAVQDALEGKPFGHTIQSDGTAVPKRTALDFVGASVTVIDDEENDRSVVQIDSAEGHVIYVNSDNGLPQRLGLKFVGGRVTTEDDPTGDKTVIRIEGGYTIEFQGVPLTYRSNLNFTGDAVLVTDDEANDTTIVNIRKHIIQEEGGGLPPREALNFVGGGIVVTDDADNNRTVVTLADGVAGGHVIQDDGVILPDRGKLNFVGDGVTLSDDPTGDATVINVTGGGGNGGSGLTIEYATAQTVNAVSGKHYVCNGTNTINLPAGTNGYMVGVSDGNNTFYNNPLTINANGTNKIGNNLQSSLTLDRNNACVVLGFTNGIWAFLSAESFNDTGVGTNDVGDGDKGDITVSDVGATWTLNNTAVTPGTYGAAATVPVFTVDSKGRLTGVTDTAIAIAQSAVTNLTADLAGKAPVDSPTFTGVPAAPTATGGTNTTQLATTAFVQQEIGGIGAGDITVDITNFNLNLSGTDTTVQAALETLDDLVVGVSTAAEVTVDTANFNGNLSGTDTTVQAALETLDDLIVGAGGHTIQDEGTPLTARTNLNFVGDAVAVTDNAGSDTTVVTINTSGTGLNWLGAWSNATSYVIDDGVEYQGSSYIATAPNLNKIPGTDPEWDLLASKGDTGSPGADGADGAGIVGNILTLPHAATPSDPGAGNTAIYAKSDGKVYKFPTGGIEEEIGVSAYSDLTDVDTTGLNVGQTMVWNGTFWVPGSASGGREVLTANRTYYVRTDGSDSNDGLTDTAGGAFLTIQKALNTVGQLDISTYDVTIQVGNGTYNEALVYKPPIGFGSGGFDPVYLKGDLTTPSNVVINSTGTALYVSNAVVPVSIGGFKIVSSSAGILVGGKISFCRIYNMEWGACTSHMIYGLLGASIALWGANYTISGSTSSFIYLKENSFLRTWSGIGHNFTLTGTPVWELACVWVEGNSTMSFVGSFWTGSATGKRYEVFTSSVISGAISTTLFPGTVAGTADAATFASYS